MGNLLNNRRMINDVIFKTIMQRLGKESEGRASQPQIIIGAAGSGKSFLMRQLFDAVSSLYRFEPVWIDGRTVFSNEDILRSGSDKRHVIFVDDFHYYLKRTSNAEQFELRGILSQGDGPILIASAPSMMPQLTNYDAAFFEGFRVYYLRTISNEDLEKIIQGTVYERRRAGELMKYLPKTPQSALTVYDIIKDSKSKKDDLILLVNRMSPLYQTIFDDLLPQQQRILCALSGETNGIQLSGLRIKTGQKTGTISPYLTQMLERGLISKETKTKRGGYYRITDPLFDMWLPKMATS